jgi:hypothetical protein
VLAAHGGAREGVYGLPGGLSERELDPQKALGPSYNSLRGTYI